MPVAKKPASPARPAPKFVVRPAGVRIDHDGETYSLGQGEYGVLILDGFDDSISLNSTEEVEILHALTGAYLVQVGDA